MSGYVCSLAGGKGGVGKTTVAVNVAVALADRGHEVALVVADLGMANFDRILDLDRDATLHDVLAGEASVTDALVEGPGGVDVLPGDPDLEAFADADTEALPGAVDALAADYDVVLLDTGAGFTREVATPLEAADGVVLVTTPDDVAVGDTARTADLAERILATVVGAVVNRASGDTDADAIADRLGREVLAVVPESETDADQPVVETAPDSAVAAAIEDLAGALEGLVAEHAAPAEEPWFDDAEGDDGGDGDE